MHEIFENNYICPIFDKDHIRTKYTVKTADIHLINKLLTEGTTPLHFLPRIHNIF